MTWTAHTYTAGEVLASSKMTSFQANFTALVEGHSGAPSIIAAAITANHIKQGSLKTTTASGSVSVSANSDASYTLTGGTYSWWTASSDGTAFGNNDVAAGVIGLRNRGGGSTFYVDERYVQASPPYNLGNGDIPLFVFAEVNANGEIVSAQVAPDPPWAYHGPTDIRPERTDTVTGRAWRTVDGVEIEIDYAYKNSDMVLFPHPFLSATNRIVMLDPLCGVTQRLFDIVCDANAREALRLVTSGVVLLNGELDFNTPPGVIGVRPRIV